ncbi:MAG: hypothetical protein ABW007_04195 [Chitinophagaceae bacterium]
MNPLFVYFIGISFLASLSVYFLPKPAERYLKLFPPFLFATATVEIVGGYLESIGKQNVALYNVFTVIEFCFYFFVLAEVVHKSVMKKIMRITIFIYAVSALVNIFFFQGQKGFHTVTYSIGCLLVVIFCIYYFWELFRLPKSVKLHLNPAFWICTGLLFFYCCGFPLYGFINYLVTVSPLLRYNFFTIVTILNIFLYSLFTIGFLCRIRIRKYTS